MSEQTTTAIAPGVVDLIPESIPTMFTKRPQWVCWEWVQRLGDEWTKAPRNPTTGAKASTTDLLTWSIFDEALEAVREDRFDGIGFCFCSADPFVGIDFDKCRNPETGEVDAEVLEYIRLFKNRYVEASVTGTGVHLITRGKFRNGKRKGKIEIYGQDRFFAMTGVVIDA